MNWSTKKKTAPRAPAKARDLPLPAAMIEIEPGFVMGSRIGGQPKPGLRRLSVTALSGDIVNPSPILPNVSNPSALGEAIRKAVRSIGGGRTGLILPDGAVRVSVLEFETLPAKPKEMESLLRWRIKEGLGFSPESARLSYQQIRGAEGRIEVLVAAVKPEVMAQYEAAIEAVRGVPVLALPATLALLPLLSEDEPGGQLLTHVCSGWVTHAVVEGPRLRLWRTRELGRGGAAAETEEVVSEAARAAASTRDRLGLEIRKAWLCSRPMAADGLKSALSPAVGLAVEDLEVGKNLGAGLDPGEQPLFGMFAAPLAGLISNAGRAQ
ncbi:MAG: hypothetical protein KGM47_11705 [Acidobacteriota bacterium]|nr:hypothetical protein [Acidobacteriota bacterium]